SAKYCSPESGPQTARQRWVGPSDEHRQMFEVALAKAGLPAAFSLTTVLTEYTGSTPVAVGGVQLPSLAPVAFESATRAQPRPFTPGELAQLPDFSFALWDWASGHEACPLGDTTDPVQCHDFGSHMGPENSNHYLPQAGTFYAHYHALAIARAGECKTMAAALR